MISIYMAAMKLLVNIRFKISVLIIRAFLVVYFTCFLIKNHALDMQYIKRLKFVC